jgi:hypothetical protein
MPTLIFGWPLVPMPAYPAYPAPASMEFTAIDAVAVAESPFTGQQQIQNWGKGRMEVSVQMPPLTHAQAQGFIAWMLGLQGMAGVFQLGDPLARSPRGTGAGSIVVSGANQTGYQLIVTGAEAERACFCPATICRLAFGCTGH